MAEEKKPKTGGEGDDPDKEFWEQEGVTDDDEKEAIRSRARVLRYHDFRRSKAEKEKKGGKGSKWYEKD